MYTIRHEQGEVKMKDQVQKHGMRLWLCAALPLACSPPVVAVAQSRKPHTAAS